MEVEVLFKFQDLSDESKEVALEYYKGIDGLTERDKVADMFEYFDYRFKADGLPRFVKSKKCNEVDKYSVNNKNKPLCK